MSGFLQDLASNTAKAVMREQKESNKEVMRELLGEAEKRWDVKIEASEKIVQADVKLQMQTLRDELRAEFEKTQRPTRSQGQELRPHPPTKSRRSSR